VPPAETAAIPEQPPDNGPPAFQKSFNPVGALLAPIDSVPIDEVDDVEAPSNTMADGGVAGSPPVHRVRDGDTLSKLAERYLGRGDRYLEIFELNRDVLSSPNLLPIGAALKIPPRDGSARDVTSRDLPAENPPADAPRHMVPVERDSAITNEPA
jgi:nucleoid-associated protein YgaU